MVVASSTYEQNCILVYTNHCHDVLYSHNLIIFSKIMYSTMSTKITRWHTDNSKNCSVLWICQTNFHNTMTDFLGIIHHTIWKINWDLLFSCCIFTSWYSGAETAFGRLENVLVMYITFILPWNVLGDLTHGPYTTSLHYLARENTAPSLIWKEWIPHVSKNSGKHG
jgi:hypothetical protein